MLNLILRFKNYLKLLVIIVCTAIIYFKIRNENIISQTLSNIDLKNSLLPLMLGIIIMTLWSSLIFNTLKGTVDLKIKFQTWTKIFFNSQFYNFIPFAGFFYKGVQLKRYNISYKNYLFNYLFIIWSFAIFAFIIYSIEIAIFVDYKLKLFIIPIVVLFPSIALIIFLLPKITKFILERIKYKNHFFNFFHDLSFF